MIVESQMQQQLGGFFPPKANVLKQGSKFKQYILQKQIGQGSYGEVWSAIDSRKNRMVALKWMKNIFEHTTFARRALREIAILKAVRGDSLFVQLLDVFIPPLEDPLTFRSICLVFELYDTSLWDYKITSQAELYQISSQILQGIACLHSRGIVHRDIKPGNIMINLKPLSARIGDFGLARTIPQKNKASPDGLRIPYEERVSMGPGQETVTMKEASEMMSLLTFTRPFRPPEAALCIDYGLKVCLELVKS